MSIEQRVEQELAQARRGEAPRVFMTLDPDVVLAAARDADRRIAAGTARPLEGMTISIKDAFDVAGERTRSGSRLLDDAPAAARDSAAVAALRAAGAIPVGRTTMSEFAFSGVGINPWFGTPGNPFDRATIPGGSTSGGAVSVADGMVQAALGTDTGGSSRIPAALCGLVGFKPTARLVDRTGLFALAPSFDAIGWMTRSVADAIRIFEVLADAPPPARLGPVTRLALVENFVFDEIEPAVAAAFDAAVAKLDVAIDRVRIPALDRIAEFQAAGALVPREAFHQLGALLERDGARCDPRIRMRVAGGGAMDEATERRLRVMRQEIAAAVIEAAAPYDALLFPTVPIAAPRIDDLATDEAFFRANRLLLRNTAIANLIDGCSISLPVAPSVGLLLTAGPLRDASLLATASRLAHAIGRGATS